jgi:hypothetical protein
VFNNSWWRNKHNCRVLLSCGINCTNRQQMAWVSARHILNSLKSEGADYVGADGAETSTVPLP